MSNDLPSDTEPSCDIRERFATLVAARRFSDANITDLTEYRRRKMLEQQVDHDLAHALARAFRSTEAAGKYDGDDK